MKRLSAIAILSLSFFYSYSQNSTKRTGLFTYTNNAINYTEVIDVPGLSSSEIRTNAKLFLNNSARAFKMVITNPLSKLEHYIVQDDSSWLVANLKFVIEKQFGSSICEGSMAINIKEGKYNYIFYGIAILEQPLLRKISSPLEVLDIKRKKKYMTKVDTQIKGLLDIFKKEVAMKQQTDF
jgi:hypothetical protein